MVLVLQCINLVFVPFAFGFKLISLQQNLVASPSFENEVGEIARFCGLCRVKYQSSAGWDGLSTKAVQDGMGSVPVNTGEESQRSIGDDMLELVRVEKRLEMG